MKRKITVSLVIMMCFMHAFCACYANDTEDFLEKLATCEEFLINRDNKVIAIIGWTNRRCYLTQITHRQNMTCGFKQLELLDVIQLMKNKNYNFDEDNLDEIKSEEFEPFTQTYCKIQNRRY